MIYIYKLEHSRKVDENCYSNIMIGFFSIKEKAEEVIKKYLKLPGFKDYPNNFIIEKIKVDHDGKEPIKKVYFLEHSYEETDDIDITNDLGVYSTKKEAKDALKEFKKELPFKKYPDGFNIDEYIINESEWKEGFFTWR